MGDFRRNILQTDFEENNSCKEIPGGKFPAPKTQYLSWLIILGGKILHRCILGKTSFSRSLEEEQFLPKPNHLYASLTPFKSQMVGPKEIFYWL